MCVTRKIASVDSIIVSFNSFAAASTWCVNGVRSLSAKIVFHAKIAPLCLDNLFIWQFFSPQCRQLLTCVCRNCGDICFSLSCSSKTSKQRVERFEMCAPFLSNILWSQLIWYAHQSRTELHWEGLCGEKRYFLSHESICRKKRDFHAISTHVFLLAFTCVIYIHAKHCFVLTVDVRIARDYHRDIIVYCWSFVRFATLLRTLISRHKITFLVSSKFSRSIRSYVLIHLFKSHIFGHSFGSLSLGSFGLGSVAVINTQPRIICELNDVFVL